VQSPAVQTLVQPTTTTLSVAPVAQVIPQQQYYQFIDNQKTVQYTEEPLQTVYHSPQATVATYEAHTPVQQGVVYSAPLTSATTTIINSQPQALGSNGYSTYTIRTSKGTSTSDVLY